jgi:hypothetical protein
VFSREIRTASFPQRFRQPTLINKYTGETDPRVWLNDYCLDCQLDGATTDEVIICNLRSTLRQERQEAPPRRARRGTTMMRMRPS